MATATKTWAFASDAEGLTDGGGDASIAFAANTGDGNPAGCVAFTCVTKGHTGTETAARAATGDTFASLFGLAAGDAITSIRLVSASDKVAANSKLTSHSATISLIDDAGSTICTLLNGRNPGTATTAWVAIGAQTGQSVSKVGSDGCRLRISYTVQTGTGGGSASTDYRIDQIQVEVTYTAAPKTGSSVSAYTFGAATTGRRVAAGASAPAVTFGATAQGMRTAKGSASLPVAFNATTAGAKPGRQGASSLPLTITSATTGRKNATASASVSTGFAATTTGVRTARSAAGTVVAFNAATAGQRIARGSSSLPIILTVTSNGQKAVSGLQGSSSFPLTAGVATSGVRTAKGAASIIVRLGGATTGSRRAHAATTNTYVLSITTDGRAHHISSIRVEAVADARGNGARFQHPTPGGARTRAASNEADASGVN